MNIQEVLDKYVRVDENGCWIWIGARGGKGDYGIFTEYLGTVLGTKTWMAHRYVYTQLVRPIDEGMTLDHSCNVHPCVNPEHLKECTIQENNARNAKDHCAKGHSFLIAANVYINTRGQRECRACRLETARKHNQKRREAKKAKS